ncbi:hypothetical protein Pmani_029215 [Petrolisthes manimaculis]|uniref:Uncharacterized protein n=1 Tax=Petrolisthes manimaculis TaxID=1843537 RepID=A0AAE1NY12_9EUCA|nr:hypothetical protein Pmani_029215 [Petrolisthes manimaculis]
MQGKNSGREGPNFIHRLYVQLLQSVTGTSTPH